MSQTARLTIAPVTGSRQLSTFIRLPRQLYFGMSGYAPPLDMEQRTLLDPRRSAFFRHGEAQYFLAWRDGRPVGRISAQIDRLVRETSPATCLTPTTGFFGALDVETPDVVAPLVEAAAGWLRARGMTEMLGPWTLNSNGEYGTMIEGQNALPMVMMPWHPTFLGPAIDAAGLERRMDVLSYQMEMGPAAEAAHVIPSGLMIGEGRLGNLSVRRLDTANVLRDGEILRTLYNDTWRETWGFVPYAEDEMSGMIKEIRPILRKEHFVLVEQNGEPAGVALVVPNVCDVAGDLGGAPSPLGWLKLGVRLLRHEFSSARVILLGVSKSVAGTALGAMLPALLIRELMNRGHELPYKTIELGWVLETNMPMRRLIERIVPEPCKRHRAYSLSL